MLPTTTDIVSRKQFDVIVVGGGAAGCATTYNLAKAGIKVALLEKYDLNTQASGRNAGSLHGQIQFEPFDELGDEWAKNFLPGLNFLAESLKMWKTLSTELKVDLEVGGNGGLMVAQTSSDMLALARKIELENSIGINSRLSDRNELKEKAPYISQSMLGAAFCPIEGKANPLTTAPAFAERAQEMGAEIHTGVEVFEISKESSKFHFKTSNGEFVANQIVLTANAGLPKLAKFFGIDLPITDVPVQVSVTEQVEKFVNHLIYFTTEKLTFKQANSGSLLIGGGWPAKYKNNGEPTFNIDSLQSNLKVALKVCPSISKINLIRTWIGVGNGTPDHNPIIGMVPNTPGAYIGMYPYMGFTASPLMGQVLTELVVNGTSSVDLKPFSPQRF
jgi:glycine/D-amino acid oxidase-like deaminating enzyme